MSSIPYIIPCHSPQYLLIKSIHSPEALPWSHTPILFSHQLMLPAISQRKQMLSDRSLTTRHTDLPSARACTPPSLTRKDRSWHSHSSIWSLAPTAACHLWNPLLSHFSFQLLQPLSGTSLLWCLCPPSLLVQVQLLLAPLPSNTKASSPLPLLHPCHTLHGPSDLDLRLTSHSNTSLWLISPVKSMQPHPLLTF